MKQTFLEGRDHCPRLPQSRPQSWRCLCPEERVIWLCACVRFWPAPISFPEAAFLLVSTKDARGVSLPLTLNARGLWGRDSPRRAQSPSLLPMTEGTHLRPKPLVSRMARPRRLRSISVAVVGLLQWKTILRWFTLMKRPFFSLQLDLVPVLPPSWNCEIIDTCFVK